MKKAILIITVLTLTFCAFAMTACENNAVEEVPASGTCTITIQDVCENQTVDLHEGDTVYNILQVVDVPVATENTGNGTAIEAINGQAGDNKKGWTFYVNGEMPMDYCDKVQVKDGDAIEWKFVEGMK